MSNLVAPDILRTDFNPPEMIVNCLADGVQVDVYIPPSNNSDFNGLLYVKGHSKDPNCRKSVQYFAGPVDFKVKFGTCGLMHVDVRIG